MGTPRSPRENAPTTATTAESTTTTAATDGPTSRLTGLPATYETVMRPAVVVKVDNDPRARPQEGLDEADIVYEEAVEGTTRFAAVFQSSYPQRVGPVRSARSTDIDMLGGLGRPILAFSGANEGVLAELGMAEAAGLLITVKDVGDGVLFERDGSRTAPYNLYTSPAAVFSSVTEGLAIATGVLDFGEPTGGEPSLGVSVNWSSPWVQETAWIWDGSRGRWLRHQRDSNHLSGDLVVAGASGDPIAVDNVVVIEAAHRPSTAEPRSPQALTVGGGVAFVLYEGTIRVGYWFRPTPADGWGLLDASGRPILLPPGRTWITVAHEGSTQPLSPGSAHRFTGR